LEKLTAIIVDDEQSARDILVNLLARFCPSVEVLGNYSNVPDAVEAIKELKPQVAFLDIEMPNYSGFEIVDFFQEVDFEMVFITAYDQYAIKAFEVSAVDYLLKPIEIERLQQAVEKLEKRVGQSRDLNHKLLAESLKTDKVSKIAVSVKGYQTIIVVNEIVAIEASESYSNIRLTDGTVHLVSKNLKHFENLLADNSNFFRSHKSWIVNFDMLVKYNKTKGDIDLKADISAKLSKYRKEEFESALKLL
jgi:two-component system LytT family response regulator